MKWKYKITDKAAIKFKNPAISGIFYRPKFWAIFTKNLSIEYRFLNLRLEIKREK